jgi:hypothetical protein
VLAKDESSEAIKAKYPRGDLTAELREMLFQLVVPFGEGVRGRQKETRETGTKRDRETERQRERERETERERHRDI